jgi:glycosyltransferase involved in cell wall biosynthesis
MRLELVLWGLTQQTFDQFTVIIVNDGGAYETESITNKYKNRLDIKYTYLNPPSEEYRPSKARNLGLKQTSCNRVMFLDCDTVPSAGLVSAHMQFAEAGVIAVGQIGRAHV